MGRSHHQSILVVLLGPKNQNKHISDLCCNLRRAITVHFLKFVPSFILLSIFHVIFNSHTRFACQLYSIKFVSQSIIILKLKWSNIYIFSMYLLFLLFFENNLNESLNIFVYFNNSKKEQKKIELKICKMYLYY